LAAIAAAGRTDEALAEFEAVSQYFPGAEARVRYGQPLDHVGRATDAKVVLTELLVQMRRDTCRRCRPSGLRLRKNI
jgi:hypothetical protein